MNAILVKNRDIERLRAFAVLFVIVAHISWIQGEVAERLWITLQPWTGVDLFFVISGFVVSGAFERDISRFSGDRLPVLRALGAFYTKRVARILPTAFAALVVWWLGWEFFNRSGAWGEGTWSGGQVTGLLLSSALFYSNYAVVSGTVLNQLGWYWSLCVEEHFYMIYPAFRLVTSTVRQRVRVLVAVVLLTWFGARMMSDNPQALQQLSHNRFDQLALGVLLFVAWSSWPDAFGHMRARLAANAGAQRRLAWLSVFLLFAVAALPTTMVASGAGVIAPTDQLVQMRVGLVVTGVISLVLVTLASFDLDILSFGFAPLGRLLVGVGARSYALYMYHLPAQWIVKELALRHPWLLNSGAMPNGRTIVVYLITLFTVVELNFRLVEQPFIAWGRRKVARIGDESAVAAVRGAGLRRWIVPAIAAVVFIALVALEFGLRSKFDARVVGPATAARPLITEVPQTGTTAEVVRYVRAHGENGVDLLPASTWFLRPDAPVVPLGGLPGRATVLCRGAKGWATYAADEQGFNNPGTTPADHADMTLLGDDSAAGVCVHESETIGAQLRAGGATVMNYAMPGSGMLLNLAQLREYGLTRNPGLVVWYFSEQSASSSTANEMRSPLLMKYLEPGFSQNLVTRSAEVTSALEREGDAVWAAATGGPLPPIAAAGAIAATVAPPAAPWGHWFDFPAVKRWWKSRGVTVAPDVMGAVFLAALNEPHPGDAVGGVIGYMAAAVKQGQADAAAKGGRLLRVYLPERRRFMEAATYADGSRKEVLASVNAAGVPILDLTGLLTDTGSPLAFFDPASPQYNAQGMRLIAAATAFAAKQR